MFQDKALFFSIRRARVSLPAIFFLSDSLPAIIRDASTSSVIARRFYKHAIKKEEFS